MGKGSGRRPTAHDKPNAYQDNWELAFGKKKNTKQITKVTANIPFEMEGDPSFEDKINYLSKLLKENYLEKLIKEEKIYFDTITKHRELANDTFDNILKKGGK